MHTSQLALSAYMKEGWKEATTTKYRVVAVASYVGPILRSFDGWTRGVTTIQYNRARCTPQPPSNLQNGECRKAVWKN